MLSVSMRQFCLAAFAVTLCVRTAFGQQVEVSAMGKLIGMAVCDGVIYYGSNDGTLRAVKTSDGSAVPGFPVNVGAAVGDGSYPSSNSGVYHGVLGKAIYLETSKHGIVKVWPNGVVAWTNKLDATSPIGGDCTPAVTPEGDVIAEMKSATNVYLVKIRESDGTLSAVSPPLATSYFNFVSSPAVIGGYIYATATPFPAAGSQKRITVLNLNDLTVRATLSGTGIDIGPAYVRGGSVYFGGGDLSGATVFKLNAVTLGPDAQFGSGSDPPNGFGYTKVFVAGSMGGAEAGVCASPTSANRDPKGTVYANVSSSSTARVVAINADSGAVRVLYDSGGEGGPGLVVSPKGVIAYGVDKTLKMISLEGAILKSDLLPGYPSRPCFDPTTNRFFVTTAPDTTGTSYLLGFDSP